VFEPNILAHSSLITLDIGVTTFAFVSNYYWWKWFQASRLIYAILTSLMLGFALASKGTAVLFLPLFVLQFVFWRYAAKPKDLPHRRTPPFAGSLAIMAGGVLVLVAIYALAFSWKPALDPGAEHRRVRRLMARVPVISLPRVQTAVLAAAERIRIPPVVDYATGGGFFLRERRPGGHPGFLMGHHSNRGWLYYYLVAFVLKTPIPILLFAVIRILVRRLPATANEYFIVLPILGVVAFFSWSRVDLGLRYILPLYPFLFVWLSRVVALGIVDPTSLTGNLLYRGRPAPVAAKHQGER
jgi:hypothetical protein